MDEYDNRLRLFFFKSSLMGVWLGMVGSWSLFLKYIMAVSKNN